MQSFLRVVNEFLSHCKIEKSLSVKTIKAYQIDLKQVNEFLVKNEYPTTINLISKIELRGYLESISTLKPKTIKRKVATLKALYNYLEFEDRIPSNPIRKMRIKIKEERKVPRVLNLEQIQSVFRLVYQEKNLNTNTSSYGYFESLRNIVVIELLFATGARVSEVANLKDVDINLDSGEIKIKGKGNKERVSQVCNTETIKILKQYRKIARERFHLANGYFLINRFNSKISDQSIRLLVKRISAKTDIPLNVTPHVFRHSFATLLLEQDVDIKYIQSFLGHSSIMTTQIYTHVNREKQKQILESKHPRKSFSSRRFA